jgi:hypothetical protein
MKHGAAVKSAAEEVLPARKVRREIVDIDGSLKWPV